LLGREISLSLPHNRVLGDLSSSGLVWHLPFLTFLSRYRQTNNNNNNTFFFFFLPTITCIFYETDFISPSRFLSTARRDCFCSSFCTDLQPVYCAAGLVPGLAGWFSEPAENRSELGRPVCCCFELLLFERRIMPSLLHVSSNNIEILRLCKQNQGDDYLCD
jgi:hypothetical protein